MTLVSTTIPNLANGISQQPYVLRLTSQGDAQVNGYSSLVEGLRKRPPTRHISKLLSTTFSDCFIQTINRDTSERYVVFIADGDLKVFGIDGSEHTVLFPDGKGYLSNSEPSTGFRMTTVADYSFIVNRAIEVEANTGDVVTNPNPYEALFWVKQGSYACRYSCSVGSTSVTINTPDASESSHEGYIKTNSLAIWFAQLLSTGTCDLSSSMYAFSGTPLTAANGWTVYAYGSTVYVKNANADFTITATDGVGDLALIPIKASVQRFTDLPAKGIDGMIIHVIGEQDNDFDDYWVKYVADSGNRYGGQWHETVMPDTTLSLNSSSMPHILVRNSDGTFSFKEATWDSRAVGDLDSCPLPSFNGRVINDIFFHRNRLGFVADENVILSRSGKFFNFFRESAIQLLDTDPIDVATSNTKVSILYHAVPWNGTLLLFSDQTQFQLGATDILTPKTISILATTVYPCSINAKPAGAGQNVYFAASRGDCGLIREYYTDASTKTQDAPDITAHCPAYIPGDIVHVAASPNENVLAVLADGDRSSLYMYRYYWQKTDKLQSSWSKWTFPASDRILNIDFILADMYLVVQRNDGVYLEVVSLEPGRVDEGGTIFVHLDRRVDQDGCVVAYDSVTNRTTITVPYVLDGSSHQLFVWYGDETFQPGRVTTIATVAGQTTVIVNGRVTKFFFGLPYTFRYRFSKFLVREPASSGSGQQPVSEGRLQLRYGSVSYGASGYFRVEVTPLNRDTYTYPMIAAVLGSSGSSIGGPMTNEGTMRFPIQSKNDQVAIDLVNDSALPSAFMSAGWEGFYQLRSKRI